ncbi:gallidermin/nisin family lantibiotic [Pseudonocardia sp. EV170527-09]|uniref:gallidermin/nisin family lantibiotic n=1 Tax=Pseudonocardia sp. EV170527-09 TaxID=2603411 RepID=UPI0011F1E87B|nr:gallidermin/nisin family lantibiotic [Pseudonocardia sp. EV170527-09]
MSEFDLDVRADGPPAAATSRITSKSLCTPGCITGPLHCSCSRSTALVGSSSRIGNGDSGTPSRLASVTPAAAAVVGVVVGVARAVFCRTSMLRRRTAFR